MRRLSFIVFKEICCGETEHYGKDSSILIWSTLLELLASSLEAVAYQNITMHLGRRKIK